MIKEIALRKLASDEGINPYGVGALGAVGLTVFGYSPLYEKVAEENKLSDKLKKQNEIRNKTEKALRAHKEYGENLYLRCLRATQAILKWNRAVKNDPKEVLSQTDFANTLASYVKDAETFNPDKYKERMTRLAKRLEHINNLESKLNKKLYKKVVPLAIGTKLIAPAAAIGLGGKYLYDKLTD